MLDVAVIGFPLVCLVDRSHMLSMSLGSDAELALAAELPGCDERLVPAATRIVPPYMPIPQVNARVVPAG